MKRKPTELPFEPNKRKINTLVGSNQETFFHQASDSIEYELENIYELFDKPLMLLKTVRRLFNTDKLSYFDFIFLDGRFLIEKFLLKLNLHEDWLLINYLVSDQAFLQCLKMHKIVEEQSDNILKSILIYLIHHYPAFEDYQNLFSFLASDKTFDREDKIGLCIVYIFSFIHSSSHLELIFREKVLFELNAPNLSQIFNELKNLPLSLPALVTLITEAYYELPQSYQPEFPDNIKKRIYLDQLIFKDNVKIQKRNHLRFKDFSPLLQEEIIEIIMEYKSFNPLLHRDNFMLVVCEQKNEDLLNILLNQPLFRDTLKFDNRPLLIAMAETQLIKVFLTHPIYRYEILTDLHYLVDIALDLYSTGNLPFFKELMNNNFYKNKFLNKHFNRLYDLKGGEELVISLSLANYRVFSFVNNEQKFLFSLCKKGNILAFQHAFRFCQYQVFQLHIWRNAFQIVFDNNHIELLNLMVHLEDFVELIGIPNIFKFCLSDMTIFESILTRVRTLPNYIDFMLQLLEQEKPSHHVGKAMLQILHSHLHSSDVLFYACQFGDEDRVIDLLQSQRIQPSPKHLMAAYENDHLNLFKVILNYWPVKDLPNLTTFIFPLDNKYTWRVFFLNSHFLTNIIQKKLLEHLFYVGFSGWDKPDIFKDIDNIRWFLDFVLEKLTNNTDDLHTTYMNSFNSHRQLYIDLTIQSGHVNMMTWLISDISDDRDKHAKLFFYYTQNRSNMEAFNFFFNHLVYQLDFKKAFAFAITGLLAEKDKNLLNEKLRHLLQYLNVWKLQTGENVWFCFKFFVIAVNEETILRHGLQAILLSKDDINWFSLVEFLDQRKNKLTKEEDLTLFIRLLSFIYDQSFYKCIPKSSLDEGSWFDKIKQFGVALIQNLLRRVVVPLPQVAQLVSLLPLNQYDLNAILEDYFKNRSMNNMILKYLFKLCQTSLTELQAKQFLKFSLPFGDQDFIREIRETEIIAEEPGSQDKEPDAL